MRKSSYDRHGSGSTPQTSYVEGSRTPQAGPSRSRRAPQPSKPQPRPLTMEEYGEVMNPELPSHSWILVPRSQLGPQEIPPHSEFYHGLVRNLPAVYTVLNGNREFMTKIPRDLKAPSSPETLDGELHQTAWVDLEMPHLLFLPRTNVFTGPLLQSLKMTTRTVPIERRTTHVFSVASQSMVSTRHWVMAAKPLKRWLRIEAFLQKCLFWLESRVRAAAPHDYRGARHRAPVFFGYSHRYESEHNLVTAVLNSRDAFFPLLATISLRILTLDAVALKSSSAANPWRNDLFTATGIKQQIWDELENIVTQIVSAPVGGIIDFSNSAAINKGALIVHFEPSDADVERLRKELSGRDAYIEWLLVRSNIRRWGVLPNHDCVVDDLSHHLPAAPKPPAVERGSGQNRGENWDAFFARRRIDNALKEELELHSQREARLRRENLAAKGGGIGKRGARVFVWSDEGGGFWVRELRNYSYAVEIWNTFSPEQRIYDGFSNEWDLCGAIKSAGDLSSFNYFDDDDDDDDANDKNSGLYSDVVHLVEETRAVVVKETTSLTVATQNLLQDSVAVEEDVQTFFEQEIQVGNTDEDDPSRVSQLDEIQSTLELRFGHQSIDEPFDKVLDERDCRRALGNGKSTKPLTASAKALLLTLVDAKKLDDIPEHLIDICRADSRATLWEDRGVDIKEEGLICGVYPVQLDRLDRTKPT
ncbi:hypothetical protein MIND_01149500 [Mycena indigotica]|uniref:Uncharacterized protein n=1 Tax=Mycena indigotica TaxID=2126181 RepID=A0A8H6S9C1_9AGAR|nr:uncharacterized protein MIND_01149500 [Mycena indigotica]KAF7293695.1 hypothetical protein MIND_01149500 [Mycena indigotica]